MNELKEQVWVPHMLCVKSVLRTQSKWFKILYSNNFLASNYHSKNIFLNSEFLKTSSSHCYQSTLVTVLLIGLTFYLSQSEISFHIITDYSNFEVGTLETICFAENNTSFTDFKRFSTSSLQFYLNECSTKTHHIKPTTGNLINKVMKNLRR